MTIMTTVQENNDMLKGMMTAKSSKKNSNNQIVVEDEESSDFILSSFPSENMEHFLQEDEKLRKSKSRRKQMVCFIFLLHTYFIGIL